MNIGLTFNEKNTRLFLLMGFGLVGFVVVFFVVRSLVRTSRAKNTADLSEGDTANTEKYDPLPLAGELDRILNKNPSWYQFYAVDCTDLENALHILNGLSTANFREVIKTYDRRYGNTTQRFINAIQGVSYLVSDPRERDFTLKQMRDLGLS